MAELMVEINKLARLEKEPEESVTHILNVTHHKRCIAEEIADVEIMLEQIKYLLMCDEIVDEYKEFKIKRQLKRIEVE